MSEPAHLKVIHYHRLPSEQQKPFEEIDPKVEKTNKKLTGAEQRRMIPENRKRLYDVMLPELNENIFGGSPAIDRSYRSVDGTSSAIKFGNTREHTLISTTKSQANIVEPLFPESLATNKKESFDVRLKETLENAQSFIFMEAYDFGRDDLVDLLIKKAKQGVAVHLLVHPLDEDDKEDTDGELPEAEKGKGKVREQPKTPDLRQTKKEALLARLREASKGVPALTVTEFDVIKGDGKRTFDQILHVKKVIADTPDDSIVEVSGGINFGVNSIFNMDTAWFTEGVAVLDSLQRVFEHFPKTKAGLPFDMPKLPDAEKIRAKVLSKIKAKNQVEIELGGAGRLRTGIPASLRLKDVQAMVAQEGENSILISARDAMKRGMADLLLQAVKAKKWVTIVEDHLDEQSRAEFLKMARPLKAAGAEVYKADDIQREESYMELIYKELEEAIEKQESIDVGAFALSDDGVLDRLVRAHRAGCPVRVVVDDLTIHGSLINQKAMARLTRVGIDVKVFDRKSAEVLHKHGYLPEGLALGDVKLHAKVMILGRNKGRGRVLGGSANPSDNGLNNNVEDGRSVRSQKVADAFATKLIDLLYQGIPNPEKPGKFIKVARSVRKMVTTSDTKRIPFLEPAPIKTKMGEIIFLDFDLETTGFAAHYDDRLVSISAHAYRLKADGSIEVLEDAVIDLYSDTGTNALGDPFEIPAAASKVHGLTRETLLSEKNAKPVQEVLLRAGLFAARVKGIAEKLGMKIVLNGYNIGKFDIGFLDFLCSRKGMGVLHEGKYLTVKGPYVDALDLSRRASPRAKNHDLDAVTKRWGISKKERGTHYSIEDVNLTSRVTGRLAYEIAQDQGRDLLEMPLEEYLPKDTLRLNKPLLVSTTTGRGSAAFQLEKLSNGEIIMRNKLGGASGGYGNGVPLSSLEVVGIEDDKVKVRFQVGKKKKKGGRGKAPVVYEGYVSPERLAFKFGGPVYYTLVEAGFDLPTPSSLRPRQGLLSQTVGPVRSSRSFRLR